MMGVDDKRALPEHAQAMICCEDAQMVSRLIASCLTTDDGAGVCIYLPYLLDGLVGVVHYQRFVAVGDDRVHLIANQTQNIMLKIHTVFGLVQVKELGLEEWNEFTMCLSLDLEFCEFAIKTDESMQDDMVVDLFYLLV